MRQAPPLTSSAAASPARTSPTPGSESGSTENAPVSGPSSLASFASFDPVSSSWRTSQHSLFEGSIVFSGTWPRSGSMRNGTCFERPTSGRPISELGSSSLPTPTASTAGYNRGGGQGRVGPIRPSLRMMARQGMWPTPAAADSGRASGTYARGNLTLTGAARLWPTPTSMDSRSSGGRNASAAKPGSIHPGTSLTDAIVRFATPTARDAKGPGHSPKRDGSPPLASTQGGQLNPRWVEWLMGFPDEWTVCDASATPSSGSKRRSRSKP